MPTVDNLDIQISTSLKNTDKQLDNLIKKLGTVSSSLSKVGGNTSNVSNGMTRISTSATRSTKSFNGLAAAFGRFYANYFLVVRGIKSLYKSIEGTADYIEAFNYFEVSFNKIASEWKQDYKKFGYDNAEAYAESFNKRAKETLSKLSGVQIDIDADGKGLLTETGMKNLGLNIQEITQYASQLASVTNSVGQTGEVSLATANSFTKLAGDISSLFNQDYSAVAKNLQSGLIGQSRALYKYGIDITNATLQTYAFKLGLEKEVAEMTQAEKMQLRMIAILDQSKVSWGDLANTIDSPSNMIRQFKNNLKEAGMVLGQLFVPLLSKVLPVINGITIAIKRLLVNIAGFLGIELDLSSFGQGGVEIEDTFDDVSDSLDNVADSAKKAKAGLRGFDELKTINMPESSKKDSGGIGGSIDLTDEILKATSEYEKVWDKAYEQMENRAQAFADSIENTFKLEGFEGLGKKLSKKIKEELDSINWETVYNVASGFGTGFADFLNGLIQPDTFYSIGTTLSNSLNSALISVNSFLKKFDFKKLGQSIASAINGFFKNANWEKALESVGLSIMGIADAISGFLSEIDWKGIVDNVFEEASSFIKKFDWKKFFESIIGLVFSVAKSSFNLTLAIIDNIAKWIKKGIKKAKEKLKGNNYNLLATILEIMLEAKFKTGQFVTENIIKPILNELKKGFATSKLKENLGSFKNALKEKWAEAKEWWEEKRKQLQKVEFTFVSLKTKLKVQWKLAKEWWSNKENLKKINFSIPSILEALKKSWQEAKEFWKKNAKLSIPKLEMKIEYRKPKNAYEKGVVTLLDLEGIPSFRFFANGGFPEDGWFRANHGEIMGKFDNGQSVVANNMQITKGISEAVYKGNQENNNLLRQEIALLQKQNELLTGILQKEYGITDSDIGKSAQRYARDYFNRTGNEAYSF